MVKRAELNKLSDFFTPLSRRSQGGVFFCRIPGYSSSVEDFLKSYYAGARRGGVVIDGRIPNPDSGNLSYFSEIIGTDFRLDRDFLAGKLRTWLPRMSQSQGQAVAEGIYSTLLDLRARGKNDNMLRNAYIKFMCWLYYKFERAAGALGTDVPPKILYDGSPSETELQFLTVICRAGADVVLLERSADQNYPKLDPESQFSQLYREPGLGPFPAHFGIKWLNEELKREAERQRVYGPPPSFTNCTNAWMNKAQLKELLKGVQARGTDPGLIYNSFLIQYGAEDKLLYSGDMFAFHQQLKSDKRRICLVNGPIPAPTPEEISQVKRGNYTSPEELAQDLCRNFQQLAGGELQKMMNKAFIDLVFSQSKALGGNLLKLSNRAVYLLAWLNRYYKELFSGWKAPEVGVFLLFGGCATENEALFLRFLARLPVDVVVLQPNLSAGCNLQDDLLLELRCEESVNLEAFPANQPQARVRTAAYQAERDLDGTLYGDTGMYRNQQYGKADAVTLQAMYEEIALLWNQELKYRPSFSVVNDRVNMPVLLEKICGVKDGDKDRYWLDIKALITEDATVVRNFYWHPVNEENPAKPFATQFLRNGRLLREAIKSHKCYPYGILRSEMQDYLLDKLQLLLDQKIIAGTWENGTEYTVIAAALNLPKVILRQIQKFDFTKKNPKIIFINTGERTLSLEDSIQVAYLNLIGFDILFFVPTGYECVEKYFPAQYISQQQIGEYLYDLPIPDFNKVQESKFKNLKKILGRR